MRYNGNTSYQWGNVIVYTIRGKKMAFGDTLKQGSSEARAAQGESPWLRTKVGDYTIRILSTEEMVYWRYWIPTINVGGRPTGKSIAVGRDNPIKTAMEALGKDHPRYMKPQRRFVLNVYDRTPIAKFADGRIEYADDTGAYWEAPGKPYTGMLEPHNVVKIFEFGSQTLELLTNLQRRMRSRIDPSRMLGINDGDIILQIRGESTGKTTFPAQGFDEAPIAMEGLKLYDLKKIYAPLPNDAVDALFNRNADWNEVMTSLGFVGNYPTL